MTFYYLLISNNSLFYSYFNYFYFFVENKNYNKEIKIINVKINFKKFTKYQKYFIAFIEILINILKSEILTKQIKEFYKLNEYVNINYIESKIPNGRIWKQNEDKLNEINIGIQLDSSYVLRVMMTIASIIDSSKPKTKLRFHIAVVLSFSIKDMLKIYSLP